MSYEGVPPPPPPRQRQVRIPFLRRAVGLGDVVAGATGAVGIQPCGGCQQRKDWLNQRVRLIPRRRIP